jgi:hypothetical protein
MEPDDLDVTSAIWMLSCNDADSIITYRGIAHRLRLYDWDVERIKQVVRGRAELFSPVVSSRWFHDWKTWVKQGGHYPGWVLDVGGKADRDKAIDDLTTQDVFRCQFRNDNRSPGITDPCVPTCTPDQVKLGIELIDRLRKARIEAREERLKLITTVAIPLVALVLTSTVAVSSAVVSYLTLKSSRRIARQTADLTRYDEIVKLWDLSTRMRGDAYESVFNSMQSAIDAAAAGKKQKTAKGLNDVRSDFYRLEIVLDGADARRQLWSDYDKLMQICSQALKHPSRRSDTVMQDFDKLRIKIHDEIYSELFVRTPEEENARQRLLNPDSTD